MTVESAKFPNLGVFDGSGFSATPSHPCSSAGLMNTSVSTTMGSEVFFRLGSGSRLPILISKGSKEKPFVWTANDLSSVVEVDEGAMLCTVLCNVLASLNYLVSFYSRSLFGLASPSRGFKGGSLNANIDAGCVLAVSIAV